MSNGWVNFGSGYNNLYTKQISPGVFAITGMIKPGTISDGVIVGTVASTHTPGTKCYMSYGYRTTATPAVNGIGLMVVNPNGQVALFGAPTNTSYAFINGTYYVDASTAN